MFVTLAQSIYIYIVIATQYIHHAHLSFVSNATRRHHAMILTYLYWQGDALGISKTLAKGLQVGRRQFAGHTKVVRWIINTRTQ